MALSFLFPGQGSQSAGMLSRLPPDPVVRETLLCAQDLLKVQIQSLDTDEALVRTENVQVALLISGVAVARWLLETKVKPQFVAGHSIGAFGAAVTAGVVPFEQALELVVKRAEAMVRSAPKDCGMAVLAGAPLALLEQIVAASGVPIGSLYVANRNAPDQIVIAGKLSAIETVFGM